MLALADFNGCVSGIVRRFLTTLSAGDTSCASRIEEIHTVPRSRCGWRGWQSRTSRQGRVGGGRGGADAFARWWLMYGYTGHGLRGGTFTSAGPYLSKRSR